MHDKLFMSTPHHYESFYALRVSRTSTIDITKPASISSPKTQTCNDIFKRARRNPSNEYKFRLQNLDSTNLNESTYRDEDTYFACHVKVAGALPISQEHKEASAVNSLLVSQEHKGETVVNSLPVSQDHKGETAVNSLPISREHKEELVVNLTGQYHGPVRHQ